MQKPVHTTALLVGRSNADIGGKYFEVKLELPSPISYIAGQYLNIVLDGQRRSYSIANAPENNIPYVHLLVERLPNGLASTFLDTAPLGSTVEIVMPFGRLIPQVGLARTHILIGTGSGIAPLRPIIEWLLGYDQTQPSVVLLWGLRQEENLFWLNWLDILRQKYPEHFTYTITLSQPSEQWKGKRGRVTEHLASLPIAEETMFYLCGSKGMIDEVRTLLKARGIPPSHILTEQFHV